MPEFLMIMKSGNGTSNDTEWTPYIEKLVSTGFFRGGSALGEGVVVSETGQHNQCTVSGFMKFEAASIEHILALIPGNPVFESGGEVEVLELLLT